MRSAATAKVRDDVARFNRSLHDLPAYDGSFPIPFGSDQIRVELASGVSGERSFFAKFNFPREDLGELSRLLKLKVIPQDGSGERFEWLQSDGSIRISKLPAGCRLKVRIEFQADLLARNALAYHHASAHSSGSKKHSRR